MAPADDAPSTDDLDDEPKVKKKSKKQLKAAKKKLVLMIIGGLFGLIVVGGGAAYFLGFLNPLLGIEEENKVAEVILGPATYHELPQIKADLKTSACRAPFLRVTISVELSKADVNRVIDTQDKIMDRIITHLRDQERQDIVGKAGSDQLRVDLASIINAVISPAQIHGIIFKEFVLQ